MKKDKTALLWCIICVLIGLVFFGIIYVMWQPYLNAEIKLKTEATIVDMKVKKRYKKNTEKEKNDNFSKDYKEYYYYYLTWEFTDHQREKTVTYKTETQRSISTAYQIGQKQTVYAYSNDGKDYKTNTIGESVIMILVGSVFIIGGIVGFFSTKKYICKEENIRKVINEKIAQSNNNNIKNG